MKRHVCAVVVGLLLALAGAGTLAADGWPSNDPDVTEAVLGGDPDISPAITVGGDESGEDEQGTGTPADATGEEESDADEDAQDPDPDGDGSPDSGNAGTAPPSASGGDASSGNAQSNGNNAPADVDRSNETQQPQEASQGQGLEPSSGQSQSGVQTSGFDGQTVEEQQTDADVIQKKRGIVNVAPAIAIGRDDTGSHADGIGNKATADLELPRVAHQSKPASQGQPLGQSGSQMGSSEGVAGPADVGRMPRRAPTERSPDSPLGKPTPTSSSQADPAGAAKVATGSSTAAATAGGRPAIAEATGGRAVTPILGVLGLAGLTALTLTVAARRARLRPLSVPATLTRALPKGALGTPAFTRGTPEPASAVSEPEQEAFDSVGVSARSGLSGSADVGLRVTTILVSAQETATRIVADARAEAEAVRAKADADAAERRRAAQDDAARNTASATSVDEAARASDE